MQSLSIHDACFHVIVFPAPSFKLWEYLEATPNGPFFYLRKIIQSASGLKNCYVLIFCLHLQGHPRLVEKDKMLLCSTIDFRKVSTATCAHASQNERLPHRIILQVLFFEQLQMQMTLSHYLDAMDTDSVAAANNMAGNLLQRDGWVSLVRENRVLKVDLEALVSRVRSLEQDLSIIKQQIRQMT